MTRTEEAVKCHKTLFREKHFPRTGEQRRPRLAHERASGFPPSTRVAEFRRVFTGVRRSAEPVLTVPDPRAPRHWSSRPRSRKIPGVAFDRKKKITFQRIAAEAKTQGIPRYIDVGKVALRTFTAILEALINHYPTRALRFFGICKSSAGHFSPRGAFLLFFLSAGSEGELGKRVLGSGRLARSTSATVCRL